MTDADFAAIDSSDTLDLGSGAHRNKAVIELSGEEREVSKHAFEADDLSVNSHTVTDVADGRPGIGTIPVPDKSKTNVKVERPSTDEVDVEGVEKERGRLTVVDETRRRVRRHSPMPKIAHVRFFSLRGFILFFSAVFVFVGGGLLAYHFVTDKEALERLMGSVDELQARISAAWKEGFFGASSDQGGQTTYQRVWLAPADKKHASGQTSLSSSSKVEHWRGTAWMNPNAFDEALSKQPASAGFPYELQGRERAGMSEVRAEFGTPPLGVTRYRYGTDMLREVYQLRTLLMQQQGYTEHSRDYFLDPSGGPRYQVVWVKKERR